MCTEGHDEIVDRLEKLEKVGMERNGEVGEIHDDVTEIKKFLIGDIKNSAPGLAERVRNLEKWVENQKWTVRLIITVFITQIIGWIFILIQK